MPLAPDAIAEFVVGPVCPPQSELDRLADLILASVPSLPGAPGALAVCGSNDAVGTNVVTVGVWANKNEFPKDQRFEELKRSSVIDRGHTAALHITARAIELLAQAEWKKLDKTRGDATLKTFTLRLVDGAIKTKVTGEYALPVLPDIDFVYNATDVLSLRPLGSEPAMDNDLSTDVDLSTVDTAIASLIIGLISPLLGAITFFSAEPIAESVAPKPEGIGGAIALTWPTQILTPVIPPFLPGKLALSWADLTVNERGITTQGSFAAANRRTRVAIAGPRQVSLPEANPFKSVTYRAGTSDLRNPRFSWSGVASSSGAKATVHFHTAGTKRISVLAQDNDGFEDRDDIDVRVTIKQLGPGQKPF